MIRRVLLFVTLMLSLLLVAPNVHAQVEVKRSDSTQLIKGKKFYVHTVEAGHTIYSIGRAYHVEVHEIYTYNPEAKDLLSLGQILLIPAEQDSAAAAPKSAPIPEAKDGFVYHKVVPGETLYRICLKYGLKEEILMQYNPGLTTNIYPGQTIKVPEPEKVVKELQTQHLDSTQSYVVQEKDTYYQLYLKYKVKKNALEEINPQLKELGLQKGMTIQIPVAKKVSIVPAALETPVFHDTNAIIPQACDSFGYVKPVYKVGFMMPFYSDKEKEINVSNAYRMKPEGAYSSFRFIHFYEGFLMAVDSMAQLGMNLELFVYDTKNDSAVTRSITQKPEFKELDLIIGPLFTNNIKVVADAIRGTETRLVNPFSVNTTLLDNNPNVFYMQPFVASKVDQLLQHMLDSMPNANVVVMHNDMRNEVYLAKMIESKYARMASKTAFDTTRFHLYSYKDGAYQKMLKTLDPNRPNVIINLNANQAAISNFVRNLFKKSETHEIILMGMDDNWNAFKTLKKEYLFALNLTLAAPSFVDYRQKDVAHFVRQFRDTFHIEPNNMAFQGFDAGWFFLNAMYRYGTHFEPCMQLMQVRLLQNQLTFWNGAPNAWRNTNVNVYRYRNYQFEDQRRKIDPVPQEWIYPDKEKSSEVNPEGETLVPEETPEDGTE